MRFSPKPNLHGNDHHRHQFAGNLVTDAQIAVIALEHDAVLHTSDADFIRFPGLRWFNPISGDGSRSSRKRQ